MARDGHIGPLTIAAAKHTEGLPAALRRVRERFYRGLDTFDVFGRGWMRRLTNVSETAEAWALKRAA